LNAYFFERKCSNRFEEGGEAVVLIQAYFLNVIVKKNYENWCNFAEVIIKK